MYELAEKLELVGLNQKESRIYAYLLSVPGAYPSDIAEKTKINRSTTYKTLTSLAIKGLVAEIEKGKKIFYRSENPKKLKYLAKNRIMQAELMNDRIEKISPILEGVFNKASGRPGVTYYEGKDAVVNAYMSHVQVEKGYQMLAFVSVVDLKDFLPTKQFKFYIKEKERLGITAKGITSTHSYSYQFSEDMFLGINKKIWPEFHYIKEDLFNFPGEITLFDNNKISIVKFDTLQPIAVIIEDQMIYDVLKAIFNIVWNYGSSK